MKLYKEIEKIFQIIEEHFTAEDLEEFRNEKICDLYLYHFGLGIWIRENLLYPKENILYSLFSENGVKQADEMSSLIITLFHYYVSKPK